MDKQTRQTLRELRKIYHTLQMCETQLARIPARFKNLYVFIPATCADGLRAARAGLTQLALDLVQFQNLPSGCADLSRKNSTIKK